MMIKFRLIKKMGTFITTVFCLSVLLLCTGCYSQMDKAKGETDPSKYSPLDIWHMTFITTLQENWLYHPDLYRLDPELTVRYTLKISKNGYTQYIHCNAKSGSALLDEISMNAILKSMPFQTLPEDRKFHVVEISFSPRGLK